MRRCRANSATVSWPSSALVRRVRSSAPCTGRRFSARSSTSPRSSAGGPTATPMSNFSVLPARRVAGPVGPTIPKLAPASCAAVMALAAAEPSAADSTPHSALLAESADLSALRSVDGFQPVMMMASAPFLMAASAAALSAARRVTTIAAGRGACPRVRPRNPMPPPPPWPICWNLSTSLPILMLSSVPMVLHVPPRALFLGDDLRRHYRIISAKGGSSHATRELRLLHPPARVQHSEGEVASLPPRDVASAACNTEPVWVAGPQVSLPAAVATDGRASRARGAGRGEAWRARVGKEPKPRSPTFWHDSRYMRW